MEKNIMMKNLFIIFLILSCSQTTHKSLAPSSDIPEKRIFPINSQVNPCDDFYSYACSNVVSTFKLRDDRNSHTFSFNDSHERLLEKKMQYFDKLSQKAPANKRETNLKNYYLACMDEESSKESERNYVSNTITDFDKIKTKEELTDKLNKNMLTQGFSFLQFGVFSNQKNPLINDLYFDEEHLMSLPERSYYQNKDLIKDFKEALTLFFKTLNKENPEGIAQNIIDFETHIANIYPLPEEFRKIIYDETNYTTLEKYNKKFPIFKLSPSFSSFSKKIAVRDFSGKTIDYLHSYIHSASVEELKNIALYHSTIFAMDDAFPEVYNKFFEFKFKWLGGAKSRSPRQERCTKSAIAAFSREIDSLLVDIIFPNFPKEKFKQLGEQVRKSLLNLLSENTWLSLHAKKEAINKIKYAELQLVTPDNDEEWDFLPDADYSKENKITNQMTLEKLAIKKNIQKISKGNNPRVWSMSPLTINAYYTSVYNKFVLPIGILQYPFYDASLPIETNLGAIGVVIGHELGHAIDDGGSNMNYKGQREQWMKKSDLAEFKNRTKSLIEQFSKIGHNGSLTLGENIGDLVGLTSAYRAAFIDSSDQNNLEGKKNFFLQYAKAWCYTARPKTIENRLKTDPHSLGDARVNEQVKHQNGFYEAYSCTEKNKLYLAPQDRVKVW